ncbi:MAG: hypothetical protein ACQESC_02500 [Nanobdellota archaeon]
MGLESKLYRHSRLVDRIDFVIGPLSALCYASGSEYLEKIGMGLDIFEMAVLKGPFIARYLLKTKDYKALMFWVPKEIIANTYRMAGIIDVAPVYQYRAKYVLSKQE